MKNRHKSFLINLLIIISLFQSNLSYSQDSKHIIFQATAPSVIVRQYSFETSKQENFVAYYSSKHNEIVLTKMDYQRFPDDYYYLIKARFTIFKGRLFEVEPESIIISIDYYYLETDKNDPAKTKEVVIDCYRCTRKPRTEAVKEIRKKGNDALIYVINEESEWMVQNAGNEDDTIFYLEKNKTIPVIGYALMLTNLKKFIVNGKKVN